VLKINVEVGVVRQSHPKTIDRYFSKQKAIQDKIWRIWL